MPHDVYGRRAVDPALDLLFNRRKIVIRLLKNYFLRKGTNFNIAVHSIADQFAIYSDVFKCYIFYCMRFIIALYNGRRKIGAVITDILKMDILYGASRSGIVLFIIKYAQAE